VPNNPSFQRKVLLAALKLLEAPAGPIIEDFPEDAPAAGDGNAVLSCPITIPVVESELSETEKLCAAFTEEFLGMRTWYDLAVRKRGRTTVGNSQFDLDKLCDFIFTVSLGEIPENPRDDIPFSETLKLAAEDLKAFYFEAMTIQPGNDSIPSARLTDWFWQETVAGRVLKILKETCVNSEDPSLNIVGTILLVPTSQM
jgi:hypothetical protein